MPRLLLCDDQWLRIEPMLHGKAGDRGRSGADNRLFVEAVLWMARTGAPWRDLPLAFGPGIQCSDAFRVGRTPPR
jgi:transposase